MEFAPIHPHDLVVIRGKSGSRVESTTSFPLTLGTEGVGWICEVGAGVHHVSVGDRVLTPFDHPSWAGKVNAPADWMFKLPENLSGEQLAMLSVNPLTALAMLSDFVELDHGDWIIQNLANSTVGRATIVIAKHLGLRTVSVVRRDGLERDLVNIGADGVVVDGPDLADRVDNLTGGADIRLGFDAIAGSATSSIASCVRDGGTIVTYGSMSGEPCSIASRQLIVNNQTLRGFWLVKWLEQATPKHVVERQREVLRIMVSGNLQLPVAAVYPLSQVREALHHSVSRGGKVLFAMGKTP
jgi:trans-2-enoyl-CoA reductase